jgi:hypothetical protein
VTNAAHPMKFWTGLTGDVLDYKHIKKMAAPPFSFSPI